MTIFGNFSKLAQNGHLSLELPFQQQEWATWLTRKKLERLRDFRMGGIFGGDAVIYIV